MNMTDDQLALVRDEIGSTVPPTDADLQAIYARRGGLVGVVRAIWSDRLNAFLGQPASFTIPGDYAQSTGANITAIQDKLKSLAGLPDSSNAIGGGAVPVTRLVRSRCDPAR